MEKCTSHEAIHVKINNLDEKSKEHDKRIGKLEEKNEDVIEMKTLMKMVTETNREHSQTLKNINSNLTQLTSNLTQLTHTVTSLDNRVINLEDSVTKIDDNSKINWHELAKKVIIMGAVSLISVAAVFIYQSMK